MSRPELLPHLQLDELLAELQNRLQAVLATRDRMRALLAAVVAIGSGLDLESTLRRVVEAAVGLVDATYGALGVIGEGDEGKRLAEFIPVGLSPQDIGRIDHWPEGRGVLGLLIDDPRPLRLADIAALVGQVQVAEHLVADPHRDAEEAAHRRMPVGEARRRRMRGDIGQSQRPGWWTRLTGRWA